MDYELSQQALLSPLTVVTVAAMEMLDSRAQYLFINGRLGLSSYRRGPLPVRPRIPTGPQWDWELSCYV